jgi:hypothetical protein
VLGNRKGGRARARMTKRRAPVLLSVGMVLIVSVFLGVRAACSSRDRRDRGRRDPRCGERQGEDQQRKEGVHELYVPCTETGILATRPVPASFPQGSTAVDVPPRCWQRSAPPSSSRSNSAWSNSVWFELGVVRPRSPGSATRSDGPRARRRDRARRPEQAARPRSHGRPPQPRSSRKENDRSPTIG